MSEAFYQRLTEWGRRSPRRCRLIVSMGRWLPVAVAAIYLAALAVLTVQRNSRLWRCLLVPAVTFGITTLLRPLLHCPRPYDVYAITPLWPPHRTGLSCPSRHTASAVILALTGFYVNPVFGVLLTPAAVIIAATRLLSGLHFIRDILVGALVSLLCGVVGFWLL